MGFLLLQRKFLQSELFLFQVGLLTYTSIDKNVSEGDVIKIDKETCKSIGCLNHKLCSITLQKEKKYKIERVYENIGCPMGFELKRAELIDK